MGYGNASHRFPVGLPVILGTADNLSKSANFNELSKHVLGDYSELIITLNIHSADRTDANETYDFYITSADNRKEWDIVHFPQIASTGAKTYVAVVKRNVLPQTVTTADPGVAAVVSGTLKTDTAGAGHGAKTLAAGLVRHGVVGSKLGYYLVVGGTTPGPVVFTIEVMVK